MRRSRAVSNPALFMLLAAPCVPAQVDWKEDLEAARRSAAAQGKPLLVLFRCEP